MRSRKRYFMTNREFYTAISNGEMNDELMAKATELIEKMDEANAKRAKKVLEKKQAAEDEKAPIREALLNAMGDEGMTASQLIEAAGLTDEVKVASVPSLLKPFVLNGTVEKVDVKVEGKKGPQRGYIKVK
nr:MAG TPA: transcriptional regulator [Caudoviricetes sp.]